MRYLMFCLNFLFFSNFLFASYEINISTSQKRYIFKNEKVLVYDEPHFWKQIGCAPKDWFSFIKSSFKKENTNWILGITASTLVLIKYDREIYRETQRFAKKLNISKDDKTKTFISFNGISLFRGPTDLGSAMYFLGDGWISIGLFSYFKTYGLLKDDWRASSTANQLVEGLLVTGFTTQLLKWSTGRQMPKMSGENSTGRWHPFASDYIAKRRRYDAFPSGHLATGMMTLTVITENYPEKGYIKPLGYSLLTLLSFQMINNGVHWASDYPVALAIGYGIGKSISSKYVEEKEKEVKNFFIFPYLTTNSFRMLAGYKF